MNEFKFKYIVLSADFEEVEEEFEEEENDENIAEEDFGN